MKAGTLIISLMLFFLHINAQLFEPGSSKKFEQKDTCSLNFSAWKEDPSGCHKIRNTILAYKILNCFYALKPDIEVTRKAIGEPDKEVVLDSSIVYNYYYCTECVNFDVPESSDKCFLYIWFDRNKKFKSGGVAVH